MYPSRPQAAGNAQFAWSADTLVDAGRIDNRQSFATSSQSTLVSTSGQQAADADSRRRSHSHSGQDDRDRKLSPAAKRLLWLIRVDRELKRLGL
jgi:hypothetical protein